MPLPLLVDASPTQSCKPVLPSPSSSAAAASSSGSRRSSGRNQGVHELSACELLIVELVRHDDSWPFMKLVTRTQVSWVTEQTNKRASERQPRATSRSRSSAQVPDYYDIISKPMALSTIREKVNNCQYLNSGIPNSHTTHTHTHIWQLGPD